MNKTIKKKPVLTGQEAVYIESAYHGYFDEARGRIKTVLCNVDLVVDRGEFVCLVGPSGCGKSTLLKLITGQENVRNAVKFNVLGKQVGFPDCRRGVVFQNYSLAPHLTVLGNIMLGLEFQAKPINLFSPVWRREAKERAREYLKTMRLSDAENKYPSELSGGMKQRAAIAQALITIDMFGMPEFLCMDEPYGALDPSTREDMQVFILKLWEKYKRTILFVTHDLPEAVFLGSRVIVLSQFWKSDMDLKDQEGSRIVLDIPLEARALSSEVKKTAEFGETVKYILETGFNPVQRRHIAEFDLRHPKSFQTLSFEEDPKNGHFSAKKLNGIK